MLRAMISTESKIEARITYSRVCSKINMYIEHCVSDERAGERDVMDREVGYVTGRSVGARRGVLVKEARGQQPSWVHRLLVVLHESDKADNDEVDKVDARR